MAVWQAFAQTLDELRGARRRPPAWVPVPVWTNHALNADMLRLDAEQGHVQALRLAMRRGELQPLSHALLPSGGFPSDKLQVIEVQAYLSKRGIAIEFGAALAEQALSPEAPHRWTIESVSQAIAEQEDWAPSGRSALQGQLTAAAETGDLRVRDPLTQLPYRPTPIRTWYDVVSPSDLNDWLEKQGVPYRLHVDVPQTPGELRGSAPPAAEAAEEAAPEAEAVGAGEGSDESAGARAPSSPRALFTDEICEAFGGVGIPAAKWKARLENDLHKNKWLRSCRISTGRRGGLNPTQSTWCPLRIARGLVEGASKTVVPVSKLDIEFRRQPLLRPFRDDWLELRRDHPAWGED